MQNIIERLKDIKTAKGLTNQQIADITGVPPGTISRLFSGDVFDPKWTTIVQIAAGLELDLNLLCGLATIEPGNIPPAPVVRTVESVQFDMLLESSRERIEEMKAMHEKEIAVYKEQLAQKNEQHQHEIEIYKERLNYHREIIRDQKKEKRLLAIYGIVVTLFILTLFALDILVFPNHGWVQRSVQAINEYYLQKLI